MFVDGTIPIVSGWALVDLDIGLGSVTTYQCVCFSHIIYTEAHFYSHMKDSSDEESKACLVQKQSTNKWLT